MPNESLRKLYVEQLQDLFSAETQILDALPKMAEAASHPELRQAFEQHRRLTEEHAGRLETILGELGETAGEKTCKGMKGLLAEGKEALQEFGDSDVLDAAMIAAAQRVEHYEIAGYGCVRTYARQLGFPHHAEMLQRTADEEGETDRLLSRLAENAVNVDAMR